MARAANCLRHPPFPSDKPCLVVSWTGDRCGEATKTSFSLYRHFLSCLHKYERRNLFLCTLTPQRTVVRQRALACAGAGFLLLRGPAGRGCAACARPHPFRGRTLGEGGKLGSQSSSVKENPASTLRDGICFIGDAS